MDLEQFVRDTRQRTGPSTAKWIGASRRSDLHPQSPPLLTLLSLLLLSGRLVLQSWSSMAAAW